MQDEELLTILKCQIGDTTKHANDDLAAFNRDLLQRYNQELYGNEVEGRSKVVASDVFETVESDMPSLARVFLGASQILEFQPVSDADVEEAKQKTKYANYLIRNQRDSFKVMIDWMKETGFSKFAVVKFFCEEIETPEYKDYSGLSPEEKNLILADLQEKDDVVSVEVEEDESNEFDVSFKVVRKRKKITIVNVPTETFLISRGAKCKDDAQLVGDESIYTKGDLVGMGYDKQMVKDLVCSSEHNETDRQERFKDQGGYDYKSGYHWLNDKVLVQELYPLVDYDDDGIPERRRVLKVGEKVLENEPHEVVPYAILSQIPMPHTAIGRSRGELAAKYQEKNTALERSLHDNIYAVSRPRWGVDDSNGRIDGGKVNLDDLLTHRIDGVIRVDGTPSNHLQPYETPYVGDKALQVIQYVDARKANALGTPMASQGLSADKLYKETATRFEGVQDHGDAKIELVARVFAETGFRELFEGVIKLAQRHQDTATEIRVLGEQMTIDPRKWRYDHYCQSLVGLGAGDSAEMIQNLSTTITIQNQLIAQGSPLADWKKLYNALADLTRIMGKPDPNRYFNDPEVPAQTLMAQNMMLQMQLQQLQQQAQQNPLAEAELIRAQAKMAEAQGKNSNDMQKFAAKMSQEDRHFAMNLAKELTKLELDHNKNIPGALV